MRTSRRNGAPPVRTESSAAATADLPPVRNHGGRCRPDELLFAPSPVCVLMQVLKMNDAQFAEFAGVSVSAVRQYRYGQKNPPTERLFDLVKKAKSKYGVETTVDDLIEAARGQKAGAA